MALPGMFRRPQRPRRYRSCPGSVARELLVHSPCGIGRIAHRPLKSAQECGELIPVSGGHLTEQSIQGFEVNIGDSIDQFATLVGELDVHHSRILGVAVPSHQPSLLKAIDSQRQPPGGHQGELGEFTRGTTVIRLGAAQTGKHIEPRLGNSHPLESAHDLGPIEQVAAVQAAEHFQRRYVQFRPRLGPPPNNACHTVVRILRRFAHRRSPLRFVIPRLPAGHSAERDSHRRVNILPQKHMHSGGAPVDLLRTSHPILHAIERARRADESCAVATVVSTHGSAPRSPGAMMMVRADGSAVGSISGGCVESALYESCLDVLATGVPRIERYGPDGDLMAPGLTCGGSITVLVERAGEVDFPQFESIGRALREGSGVMVTTEVGAESCTHTVTSAHAPYDFADLSDTAELDGTRRVRRLYAPPPRMIIVGSTDFAAEVAVVGSRLSYRVTVCDARTHFATADRIPHAHEVLSEWPSDYLARERDAGRLDERTAIIVLTHDPKIDVPVLTEALRRSRWTSPPQYVGAMGSRTADARRRRQLAQEGVSAEELDALSSPIGLDIGSRTPAETAVSIAAELVASRAASRRNHFQR